LEIPLGDETANETDRAFTMERRPELDSYDFKTASVPFFKDAIGALLEFQKRYADTVRQGIALTGIGKTIFERLDYCSRTGQIVVIEGKEGLGKSKAVETWCEMHLGKARLVRLTSITNRATFFRAIAEALGVGASLSRTPNELQTRVERALHDSRIMLIIDEAHGMLPQSNRINTRPELVDWTYSALYNRGVPCALVSTPQFRFLMERVEKQTGWNSAQFKRRIKRFDLLPERHTVDDLKGIVRKLLPGARPNIVTLIVGYAGALEHQMDAVIDLIRDARLIAEAVGRDAIGFQDVERAYHEFIEPTELAKKPTEARNSPRRQSPAGGFQKGCNRQEKPLQGVPRRTMDGRDLLPEITHTSVSEPNEVTPRGVALTEG
jgi:hypothetical protein